MKVLLAIPTGGHFHYKLVSQVVKICGDKRHEVELFISHMIGNEANRNAITDYFLKGDYDFLLMLDTDQVPIGNPLDGIKHDKDVLSWPTILQIGPIDFVWGAFDKSDDPSCMVEARKERGEGLEQVHAVSTGCILIKRKVLKKIPEPFNPHRDNRDTRIVTQDIVFSAKCEAYGFEVWVDWDHITRHFKEVDLVTL